MIRTNKHPKPKPNKVQSYNYRNALYQGETMNEKGIREGKGIIYITDTHHFIACNNFHQDKINSYSLFFHSHSKYHYGRWVNDKPEGVTVFRMNQVLIMAEYQSGLFVPGSKMLLLFQKYNLGILLSVNSQSEWQIVQKSDVLCNEQLEQLIASCQFKKQTLPYLLIRYLNNHMVEDDKSLIKLRLIKNMYYRFGFDQGLAIIFDDEYRISSVGVHNRSSLTSFGVKFNNQRLGNKIEEGIFDGPNTFVFDQPNKPIYQIGQLYCRKHLSEVNFKNEIYKDPSESYFQYVQGLLKSDIITQLFCKTVIHPIQYKSFQKIMEEQHSKEQNLQKYEKLELPELQATSFKKTEKENFDLLKQLESIKKEEAFNAVWESSHRNNQKAAEFQKLPEKNRLEILKKELAVNLNRRSRVTEREESEEKEVLNKYINATPPPAKNMSLLEHNTAISKLNDVYIYELPKVWREQPGPNLQKKIDIRINNFPEEKQSKSVSKSRKKIFQQLPNVIRDYSPQHSPSPSPFKSKMRSKIFSKTPEKSDKSKSKSARRIFNNSSTPERLSLPPQSFSKTAQQPLLSPHQLLELSGDKNDSSSHIKAFPVTMSAYQPLKQQNTSQQKVQGLSQQIQPLKDQKVTLNNYLALNNKSNSKPELKEENQKKSNIIYKNKMKKQYGDYVFQPINIQPTGNTPYLSKTSIHSNNMSNKTLGREISKKSISETNPQGVQKMTNYMKTTPFNYRQTEKLSDFKRRVNYF